MLKIFLISQIFIKILIPLQAKEKICNFSDCNHEGLCTLNEQNEKLCSCIGTKYFQGAKCSQVIDLCQTEKPCRNGGICKPVVGQFICENCTAGFGGQWCDVEISNGFENMLLYFNHYGFYGEKHKFLIMAENLGEKAFSLEFVAHNYAIESFETKLGKTSHWIYSEDLRNIIKQLGIRYYQDMPYTKGYYHISTETFWDLGELALTLRCYDTETAALFVYQYQFDILITQRQVTCVPELSFIHGLNPLDPLMVDIASYNNFEIIMKKTCFKNSVIKYQWSVFNSIGKVKLHDFGYHDLVLKIQPYKLWFNYHGDVMSSYSLVVKMVEENGGVRRETQTRCFIFVLPKPVTASIKGGNYREIGVKQEFSLDASNSRDFALAPSVRQDLSYRWNCVSKEDSNAVNCKNNMSSAPILNIKSGYLQIHNTYNFTLIINSKVNKLISDQTYQIIKIIENPQLSIDLKCLRNCVRNQFIAGDILHLKAIALDKRPLSKTASFQWSLQEQVIGNSEHLVYKTQENTEIIIIQLLVLDQTLSGTARQTFRVNLPPYNGSCYIEPSVGQAFITNFHIKCQNYYDHDTPLNYEYIQEGGFPLQRTNEAEIHTKLAECQIVIIKICDQFQACLENQVKVEVKELEEIKDVENFIKTKEVGLKQLLLKGDILTAMILLKSITKSIKTIQDLTIIEKEMELHEIKTLLEIEQFVEISKNLLQNNLPLTAAKTKIFNNFFLKLQQGFKRILKDKEIQTFKKLSYEKSSQELLDIMRNFAQTWETITPEQTLTIQPITSLDPLREIYPVLPDFDINIADQLKNWLESSRNLMDCFNFMFEGSKELYAPWEEIFSIEEKIFYMKILAFDNSSQQEIEINGDNVKVLLNEVFIQELQENFASPDILLQITSLNANPFWWFPTEHTINTEVFTFNALSRKSSKNLRNLKTPFEFQLQLKSEQIEYNVITGVIKTSLHMTVYNLQLPGNAVLVITFLKCAKPLKFLAQIEKAPSSFQVLKIGQAIIPLKDQQSFIFLNPLSINTQTFLAILMESVSENVTFSFYTQIRECLFWDFSLPEPQWSSQGCKPKLEIENNNKLICYCQHFSTFGGATYQGVVQEVLKEHVLLKELGLNWVLVGFYWSLIILGFLIISLNFYQFQIHTEYLPISSSGLLQPDIEVQIFTGSHWNSGSTSNITLRFISQKGPFTLTIHQNPWQPFLKRNSQCKVLLSSQEISLPLKLNISNDVSGRYPSWYCYKIQIINLKNRKHQIFLINQWINRETLEVMGSEQQSFENRFRENLAKVYINWFEFQALWGCWHYEDLNRLERSCLWWSQLLVSIGLVAGYFGCTSMETYEDERVRFYYLNFNILELFSLSIVCYLFNFVLKLVFRISLWLFYKINVKSSKKSKKSE